jgi:serine-type D-Ala-D-Ala endopeptidase (penicillin-binding protein 7)
LAKRCEVTPIRTQADLLHCAQIPIGTVMRSHFRVQLMRWPTLAVLVLLFANVSRASVTHVSVAKPSKPDIRSNAALVIDAADSSVLFARQANTAVPIASITKLMTALVVLDAQQPLDESIKIVKDDRTGDLSGKSRLAVGSTLTRGELLHLALMSSENRAAHAVGRSYPGGIDACVLAMNAKAVALGMTQARFVDPTGLSSRNVASPADLSKLVMAASKDPTIARFSTDKDHTVRVGKQLVEYRNTNTLVAKPTWDIAVQKTGYIAEAGKCLVMKATIHGRSVVIVLMDSFGKYTRTADANRIKKWMEASATTTARL